MRRLHYLYFIAGVIVFLMLHIHFVLAWDTLYAHHPWAGTRADPPFISTSERSVMIANIVLFATALGLTLIPPGNRPRLGVAVWSGVMSAVVLVWVATARLRQDSNMWPIDFVFLSVLTGLPMLWGRTTGLVYWRIRIGQRLNPWLVFLAVASLLVVVFLRF